MMFRKYLQISFINTIRMNYRYFGMMGILHTYILCGKNLKIKELQGSVQLHIKKRGIVRIGFGDVEVIDGRYNRAVWSNKGEVVFKGDAHFCKGAKIIVKETGTILFGDHYIQNGDTQIISHKKISFGDNCLLSWGSLIMDSDFHTIYKSSDNEKTKLNSDKEIVIGNHCWIGANTLIFKGTVLADNTILSAGSIVRQSHQETDAVLINDTLVKQGVNWTY